VPSPNPTPPFGCYSFAYTTTPRLYIRVIGFILCQGRRCYNTVPPHVFYTKNDNSDNGDSLKALISVEKEGKYYVATDLVTNVADQGLTEDEAISRLKKGLEEHYQILMGLAPKTSKKSFIEIEVEKYVKAPSAVGG
jgi:predicted RNase H-like HicB family nuclease